MMIATSFTDVTSYCITTHHKVTSQTMSSYLDGGRRIDEYLQVLLLDDASDREYVGA